MSLTNRIPSMRHPSMGGLGASGQSPALVTRINEKRAELENLKQLRELSATLADQMQILENKLSTLSDGTEAVAHVLANWHNVLQAINMASVKVASVTGGEQNARENNEPELPETLVRVPARREEKGED